MPVKKTDEMLKSYIDDCNRTLKGFLDNGADVNAKGNAKTIDWQTYNPNLTYEEFQDLCKAEDATTPLYEAIKKGMIWESQVDLLLEYGATLDESCLEAARLSGDEAMVEKVERLLKNPCVSLCHTGLDKIVEKLT